MIKLITETEVNNCFSIISVHAFNIHSVMNIIYFLFKYAMSKIIGDSLIKTTSLKWPNGEESALNLQKKDHAGYKPINLKR